MPPSLKQAHVIPVLKKSSLDHNELKNYRPISNLAFSSKLIERVVSHQLNEHCLQNKINIYFQSAYKKHHSTETALTRVQNDLLKAVDSQGGAVLVLLDLSAAFDTIDHEVMLNILQYNIGVTGSALAWFTSYLTDRNQYVKVNRTLSKPRDLPYGVPQGSVLGPVLFSLYTQPLQSVIEDFGISYHLYADDTQLYMAFNPKSTDSASDMMQTIDSCTTSISTWMRTHFLKLNCDKTELLIITKPSLKGYRLPSLDICESSISSSIEVKDLGVYFDSALDMQAHVKYVCKKAYHQLFLIRQVRKFINEDAARQLVNTNVTTLLDYCNAVLIGLPASEIDRLQKIQNYAARIIKQVPRYSHITPVLKELHWLPIKFRIEYKIIMMTFKALNGLAPQYIEDLVTKYQPSRNLRSMNAGKLVQPPHKNDAYGGRSFEVVAPMLWNGLTPSLRRITSLPVMKTSLKTHLFKKAYP